MITWGQSRDGERVVNNVFCTKCREILAHDVHVVDAMIMRAELQHDCSKGKADV
jgi:hypothetical protein